MTRQAAVRSLPRFAAALLASTLLTMSSLALAQDVPQGGTMNVAIQTMPESFNPVLPIELNGLIVANSMFAPIAAVNPENQTTEPYLAESWEASEDLRTWTFHLRPEAVWHDGEPITAEDVKFTYDRIADPDEATDSYQTVQGWERVEVVDEHTFRIVLEEPNALLPDVLSSGGFEPLPEHVFAEYERLADAVDVNTRNPVGSGPFKLARVDPGSAIEVEAFDDFFFGRPNLDRLVFRIVRDQNTAVAQMRAGDLDWIAIQATHLPPLESDPNVTTFAATGSRYVMAAINMADVEPWSTMFEDARVRKAMFYAVDREEIAERIGGGIVPVQHGVIPDSLGWVPEPDIEPYTYDPERARELLDEAGWVDSDGDGVREKDGQALDFYVLVDRGNATREQIGLVLQSAWEDIGMSVEYIVTERTGRWLEETRAGTFPVRISTFPVPNGDWAYRLFHTEGLNNSQSYSNPEVDAALDAMFATADREEQGQALKRMQEAVHEDPFIMPFFLQPNLHAIDASFKEVPRGELKLATPYAFRIYQE